MEHLLTFSLQPQGRTRCRTLNPLELPPTWHIDILTARLDHHPRSLCRQEVRDHLAPRQRHQVAPLPPRPRRRCRALPPEGHPPHVEEQAGQEEQGQAFRQAGQLYVNRTKPSETSTERNQGHAL